MTFLFASNLLTLQKYVSWYTNVLLIPALTFSHVYTLYTQMAVAFCLTWVEHS